MKFRPGAATDLEALRLRLSRIPRPPASPAFQQRLRSQFVTGTIPATASRRRVRRAVVVGAGVSAAAAALLAVSILAPGPAWEVSAVTGTGVARIDGVDVPLTARAALAARLRPGAQVVLPEDAQLDLVLPGTAVMQIVGGTRATVPGRPGRWIGRSITASLDQGELRVTTGPRFAGARLTVVTPEMRAVVSGTTLAVLRDHEASCVCVLEGRVTMVGGGASDTVPAGFRRSLFRAGGRPLLEPIRPMEAMKLSMLRDRGAVR